MNMRALTVATFGSLVLFPAMAHHSPAALYLMDQQTAVEGVVTEYQFTNPHARIFLDVTNADGDVESWLAEGGTPIVLRRRGWNGEEVKPGDRVRITGNPSRDGSNLIHWATITLPDGRELAGEDIDFEAIDRQLNRRRVVR